MRTAILAQGGDRTAPVDLGRAWELDTSRRPAGYTLSDDNQTALNTAGGSDYRRWVPSAQAILPTSGRRYWEVLCAPGGAASFDGYLGVVSAAQREEFDLGLNPITRGSIGWRGNGTLWSSNTATAVQQLTGLPRFGAGDVLMFVLDPAHARLWIGKNGIWQSDPVSGDPIWTAAPSAAFYPQIQGRNPGDGGSLRSLPAQFSYPVPSGVLALGQDASDLGISDAAVWIEGDLARAWSLASVTAWREHDPAARLSLAACDVALECDPAPQAAIAHATLYIEWELP